MPCIESHIQAAELFAKFDVPLSGYIINRVLPAELKNQNIPEYLKNRIQMQEEHMGEIWEIFGDRVRAINSLRPSWFSGSESYRAATFFQLSIFFRSASFLAGAMVCLSSTSAASVAVRTVVMRMVLAWKND